MATINAYLTFNGKCREAMNFYQSCLGGDLQLQTVGESPMANQMPVKMKEHILHATLIKGEMILMGSDMVSEDGLVKGNTVSMALNLNSEEEIRNCYKKLSEDGKANHPLENTFWGALFGDLTDKYGNHWVLNFTRQTS
ncbi:MAG TPA: VOC family protein [Bacteroidia bacterium]|nr:VOC family protein [Bacteroidia bacterium]